MPNILPFLLWLATGPLLSAFLGYFDYWVLKINLSGESYIKFWQNGVIVSQMIYALCFFGAIRGQLDSTLAIVSFISATIWVLLPWQGKVYPEKFNHKI